jgi:hypothetical protein
VKRRERLEGIKELLSYYRQKAQKRFYPSLSFCKRKGGDFPQPLEIFRIQADLYISAEPMS